MTADGVIPEHAERARVAEVGKVTDLSGAPLTVGVRGGHVVIRPTAISGHVLDEKQVVTFLGLVLDAIRQAARDTSPP